MNSHRIKLDMKFHRLPVLLLSDRGWVYMCEKIVYVCIQAEKRTYNPQIPLYKADYLH